MAPLPFVYWLYLVLCILVCVCVNDVCVFAIVGNCGRDNRLPIILVALSSVIPVVDYVGKPRTQIALRLWEVVFQFFYHHAATRESSSTTEKSFQARNDNKRGGKVQQQLWNLIIYEDIESTKGSLRITFSCLLLFIRILPFYGICIVYRTFSSFLEIYIFFHS